MGKKTLKPLVFMFMDILFVGINPHPNSVKKGHYFSNNSRFFSLLKEAGITPEKVIDTGLREHKIGIMNLSDYPSAKPEKVPEKEWEKGVVRLKQIISMFQPKKVVFIGKFALEKYLKVRMDYGRVSETFYVVPFPTYAMEGEEKLRIYKGIREDK